MDELRNHFRKKKGGTITMPFIFANEMCEKFAAEGFGTSNLTPLLGAFIADSYAGRFWTITVASVTYQIGMACLTVSASLPQLRPPPSAGKQLCKESDFGQPGIIYFSLLMVAIGSGGIRPCVAAFGADQVVQSLSKRLGLGSSFGGIHTCCLNSANIGWGLGLGIPTIAMLFSISIFVVGLPFFQILDPAVSPYTRLLQVIVAAFKKRKVPMVSDPNMFYENAELDASISTDEILCILTSFSKFFDKVAIVASKDDLNSSKKPNLWKLNTVHRVEELKCIIRMLPIWGAGIIFFTASAQQQTSLLNKQIPWRGNSQNHPKSLLAQYISSPWLLCLPQLPYMTAFSKFTGLKQGVSFLHRMAIGFFISIFATLVAGFIKVKNKHIAAANGLIDSPKSTLPISVFWLVPQYSLHGI
ncbi:protein nrt1/ ptr family 3.1 [Quercus suber]|uniref:Protein nrt1/ ptr family 3.1 n=1 Tax=Quercus suber TaxID=58331 RepID=A0AAW0J107_QUESU